MVFTICFLIGKYTGNVCYYMLVVWRGVLVRIVVTNLIGLFFRLVFTKSYTGHARFFQNLSVSSPLQLFFHFKFLTN